MTPNEQWAALYLPITERRRQAINYAREQMEKYRDCDRMLAIAMTAAIAMNYRKKKNVFLVERQAVTCARKSGADPVIWKLTR